MGLQLYDSISLMNADRIPPALPPVFPPPVPRNGVPQHALPPRSSTLSIFLIFQGALALIGSVVIVIISSSHDSNETALKVGLGIGFAIQCFVCAHLVNVLFEARWYAAMAFAKADGGRS